MAESFSNRHGYRSADAEITVHEDAPENLRHAIPLIGQDIGMSPSAMRRIICQVLLVPPDRNNWSVDLPGFSGERLAHFPCHSLVGDGALEAER